MTNCATIPVIAIDGPSASGKGTVAARVAQALGWHALDSGALYRVAAWCVCEQRVDAEDAQSVARVAASVRPVFRDGRVYLAQHGNMTDVSDAIRQEAVGEMASRIAVQAPLREALLAAQRAFRQPPGLVADGRDMGTRVFPDADLKIFLVADVHARALRRYNQLMKQGISVNLKSLTQDLQARDARDCSRAVAPLVAAADARIVDSSALDIQQTVDAVLGHWSNLGGCSTSSNTVAHAARDAAA